ncbi:hypothetical protein PROFUN_10692 [Planoprotostelium fungivorum]|uniref:Transglycosylase SLT domain-containing protein n=1 Tax=Planoprotostelium fungivorum TaxID=1890364 RepID=A0A2P6N9K4_9EUKA|nr:hypothetical protein PROFUN_10692 [Planoprotostelium fungivorum]
MNSRLLFALALCGLFVFTFASNCGGNCPANNCKTCPCGTKKSFANIQSTCSQWKGINLRCCNCIANAESSGNANAMHGNGDGSIDVGLFQINSVNWKSCNGGRAPCGLSENIKCAKSIYGYKKNFSPWATCGGCGCCGSRFFAELMNSTVLEA